MSANETVPTGTCDHSSVGEPAFRTAKVNLPGITPPSAKSGVVSVNPGFAGGVDDPPLLWATAEATHAINKNVSIVVCMFAFLQRVAPGNGCSMVLIM